MPASMGPVGECSISPGRRSALPTDAAREPARLDQAVEIAPIEKQSANARQRDARERPALDQVSDGPPAHPQALRRGRDIE